MMGRESLRDRGAIVGVGESAFSRRADRPARLLALEAARKAIADAGLTPRDIDGIVTDSGITPTRANINDLIASLNIPKVSFLAHGGPGGAGIIHSPMLATMAVEHGLARNVLFYFVLDFGSTAGSAYESHRQYRHKPSFEFPYYFYGQPVDFAPMARRYQYEYGYTDDDMTRGLGALAVACRKHAQLHPGAQMRDKPMTLDDYRAAPILATPLRLPDVCLQTDGAVAYVVTSAERARDYPRPPVYVMGAGQSLNELGASSYFTQQEPYTAFSHVTGAAKGALEMAGVTLKDVDFAEVYDCFTIALLWQLEAYGFCPRGEGIRWVQGGRVELGGELPLNTHGGNLSHAYLMGATHVVEAVRQLRGEAGDRQVQGAEIGWVSGDPSCQTVTILRR